MFISKDVISSGAVPATTAKPLKKVLIAFFMILGWLIKIIFLASLKLLEFVFMVLKYLCYGFALLCTFNLLRSK
ncbi:hypothetical protein V9K67_24535 [Paraflavisolibacter sp. H34]|uniref:hypothetical protein n=1 Tax=Huijunlia imazamoxiresistens TaxID=3127457 RepID=UPI00301743CD